MSLSRRQYSKELKLRVLREHEAGKSLAVLGREYEVHPGTIIGWRKAYESCGKDGELAFPGNGKSADDPYHPSEQTRIAELERMVGQLTMENDLLKKAMKRLDWLDPQPSRASGNGSGK